MATPTCPNGHRSAFEGWCEVCGQDMAAATNVPLESPHMYGYSAPTGSVAPFPADRPAGPLFHEDGRLSPPHPPGQQPHMPRDQASFPGAGVWFVTVGPDRSYFEAMMRRSGPEASGLTLPPYSPDQHLALAGDEVTIGRDRAFSGEAPDIDLSEPPEDPGVSHQHALLVQQPDASWSLMDQNSRNGTTVNGSAEPIQPYVPVPLRDGDRIHVGAWTTITLRFSWTAPY
ncbi:FHA domain-containing protein [Streptomyces lavendulocolor]|uniref:FHA domain-containing protein n=1 Tax=Streptomyces lavendulocolor TaxID=67316 RepID=UPI0033D40883